jgi:integrase
MANATKTTLRLADDADGKALPRKLNFTVDALARLSCPAGKDRLYVYDAKTLGLAVMVSATGARAFYLVRKVAGRTQRVRLGGSEITIEQARKLAAKLNGEIAGGNDPTALKRAARKSETLQELFDRWLSEHGKARLNKRTWYSDKSRFDTCLADLASRKVLSISDSDVQSLHRRIGRERGHVTANRAVQLLRRLFGWAKLERNAASNAVTMFREESRTRFVRPDEMAALFAVLESETTLPIWRDYFKVVLFSGQRRSAVAAMHQRDIDVRQGVWTVPASDSKNHQSIAVPLAEPALAIIKSRWGCDPDHGYIFPALSKSGHVEEPGIAWRKIRESAGLPDITIHDLRRSNGSYQAALGSSMALIGASLGHRDLSSTQIYTRLDVEPVRQSISAAVAAMVAAGEGGR